MSNRTDPFAVYIHWPFCAAKCPYCDFNSHVRHGGWDEARFLDAYLAEIAFVRAQVGPQTVHSIFFGGGTPSLMQPKTTAAIIDAVAKNWTVPADTEISLEANPGSVEADRFAGFKTAGINRVSLGVQSLRDEHLKALGRVHSAADAKVAIEIARKTFARMSFDLIYARPKQSLQDWRTELTEALALAGEHLSLYQLTIEPATPFEALFKSGKLAIPDDDLARDFYALTQDMTAAQGFPAYEISNHARPGAECRHNLVYWRYGTYAGIGPGAHGRVAINGRRHATVTERNPENWREMALSNGHGFTTTTPLSNEEQADEALLMGLRLHEGLDLAWLATLDGTRPSASTITGLLDLGLIEHPTTERIRATPAGQLVLNAVVAELSKALQPVHNDQPNATPASSPDARSGS
jgi:putative oxygen-independent coproporphyrinogen III oxidase